MGKLESDIQFTGRVGNLTAYRMRGVDKIIVRRRGGASRTRIKNDPEFARTRENNAEFSGRAQGVKWVMSALDPLRRVADHSLSGPINKRMAHVQFQDDVNDHGHRSIVLSKHGSILEGFSLNRYSSFGEVVKAPLICSVSRDTLSASVEIPELIPRLNFFPPQKYPVFSIMALLSVVPDLHLIKGTYTFTHPKHYTMTAQATTPWLPINETAVPASLELKLSTLPPDDNFVLMLSVGIRMGTPYGGGIEDVKHAGCGKVLRVSGLMG